MLKESVQRLTGALGGGWLTRLPTDRVVPPLLLLGVILVGLMLRYDDLAVWLKYPAAGSALGGEFYTTTYDGYHYLGIARDIAEGQPGAASALKGVPDFGGASQKTPLLSYLIGHLSRLTGIAPHHLGALLMPLFGVLVAFPVYRIGRLLGGRATGLAAALFTLCVPYYVYRSAVGWIDTDGLNVFFAVLAAWLFAEFGVREGPRRYLYYAGAVVGYLCFLWWWDQAPGPVTAITAIPLLVVLLFHYRAPRREVALFAGLHLAVVIPAFLLVGVDAGRLESLLGTLRYIAKDQQGVFPNIGISISEQKVPTLDSVIEVTSGEPYIFVLAVVGLVLLALKQRTLILVLAAPLLLSLFSFLFAQRFLIFLAPVAGIGAGYLVQWLWDRRGRWSALKFAAPLLAIGLVLPNVATEWSRNRLPKPAPSLISVLDRIGDVTAEDTVVWAWWDYGYPIGYWSRRGTIADGSYHPGERMVYLAYPLTVANSRLAANFIQFFAVRGLAGIHQVYGAMDGDIAQGFKLIESVLENGPEAGRKRLEEAPLFDREGARSTEAWLAFFYPPKRERRPVVVLLSEDFLKKSYWWFWFGSWDIGRQEGIHPQTTLRFLNLQSRGNLLSDGKGTELNRETGAGKYKGRPFVVYQLNQWEQQRLSRQFYPRNPRHAAFTYYPRAQVGTLYDRHLARSVYGRLYLASAEMTPYFRPLLYRPGMAQLWSVKGDTLE